MANPFLNREPRDIETALLLEKAIVHDIGKVIAYTDGESTFMNTDDKLAELLPVYDDDVKRDILWHEETHKLLHHHSRYMEYINKLSEKDSFNVTKEEVNVIMDILVHDWMTARGFTMEKSKHNPFQFRDCNVLKYTFKTYTLEEMLDEYAKHKHDKDEEDKKEKEDEDKKEGDKKEDKKEGDKTKDSGTSKPKDKKDSDTPKDKKDSDTSETEDKKDSDTSEPGGHHSETDWSALDNIDTKEFITGSEAADIKQAVDKLKRTKLKFAKLTETLNGLVTSTRKRTYTMPSTVYTGSKVLLKGSVPGKSRLYLIFDASGSMYGEMELFKEIISKSIPQAMNTPCEWFAGGQYGVEPEEQVKPYKKVGCDGYYKATFKDFMAIVASGGFNDDGDRTIELCYLAEQLGYSPIGVTDGGFNLSWSKDKLKQLKRTVLIGHTESWLNKVKAINPSIHIIHVDV